MIENNFSALELAQQYKEARAEDDIWLHKKARAAIRNVKGGAA